MVAVTLMQTCIKVIHVSQHVKSVSIWLFSLNPKSSGLGPRLDVCRYMASQICVLINFLL